MLKEYTLSFQTYITSDKYCLSMQASISARICRLYKELVEESGD